jgi:hypothetical protein
LSGNQALFGAGSGTDGTSLINISTSDGAHGTVTINSGTITLTAGSTINLNAPIVLINGASPVGLCWQYQTVAYNVIYAGDDGSPGTFMSWSPASVLPPGTADPMGPTTGALTYTTWTAPYAGMYMININIWGRISVTSTPGRSTSASVKAFKNGIGIAMSPIVSNASLLGEDSRTGSTFVRLAVNDTIIIAGYVQNNGGGPYVIENPSSLLIQFISA